VVRRLVAEHNINVSQVKGSGKNGRVIKEDVEAFLAKSKTSAAATVATPTGERVEERVAMSRLRSTIANRLVEVKQTTAMLTTFNEVDMQPVMELRAKYKASFEKRHGVRLGFMSFFTKACIEALRRFPTVNASIDGKDIIYHAYQDVGIAVSTEKGLVVPVLRDAQMMSFAGIESNIRQLAGKARDGKLTLDEMTGGTFTITNGGGFGSLMSTPIINAPQSAILGMHAIKERPIAENGQVVIKPMMYLSLSYDHRIIDGKDSVQFLVAVKELLEDPARLLLEV
jgi:2-oxoglutarate dehydrogenase E2 component (dihydrolipoamide succinyltransferase)